MKRCLLALIGVGVFCVGAVSEEAGPVKSPAESPLESPVKSPVKVKVLKDNVNVRAKPAITSETVAQVSENDELVVKSMGEEWVEIVPPLSVDLWVLGDYVKDGVISGEKVNVRAGAGINYSIVGKVSKGTNVVVRKTHAQWVSIEPPEACSLWIHSSLV
ncbi:SH3 domain-containing protein, partial [Verrucomicrobiota bacterium]